MSINDKSRILILATHGFERVELTVPRDKLSADGARRVWPDRIIVDAPCLDHDTRLCQRVEDLAIQQLVAELRVEALAVTVLPRAARFDECRLRSHGIDPIPNGFGDGLRAVVRANVTGHAS